MGFVLVADLNNGGNLLLNKMKLTYEITRVIGSMEDGCQCLLLHMLLLCWCVCLYPRLQLI